jgi:iron complex transport system substrate-binding protein
VSCSEVAECSLGPVSKGLRLVSLCPSITELLFTLGAGEALVGRTRFCVRPPGLVDRVERVGGTKNPKLQRILELRPDLVFMNEEENRAEDAEALQRAGLAVHRSFPRSVAEAAAVVRSIAVAVSRGEAGERLAARIESEADRIASDAATLRPIAYAYVIWREPWMVVGADTYVSDLLSVAGGSNVFRKRSQRYPTVTLEELRESNPDVVYLASEPFPFQESHLEELMRAIGWDRTRFKLVDGQLLSWHGSLTLEGLRYAERLLRARQGQ